MYLNDGCTLTERCGFEITFRKTYRMREYIFTVILRSCKETCRGAFFRAILVDLSRLLDMRALVRVSRFADSYKIYSSWGSSSVKIDP